MLERPDYVLRSNKPITRVVGRFAGMKGFEVPSFLHDGSLPGSYAMMFHRWDGYSWIALFNQRSQTIRNQMQRLNATSTWQLIKVGNEG